MGVVAKMKTKTNSGVAGLVNRVVELRTQEKEIQAELKVAKEKLLKNAVEKKVTKYTSVHGGIVEVRERTIRTISVETVWNRVKEVFKGKQRRAAIDACFSVKLETADKYLSKVWVDGNLDAEKKIQYLEIKLPS